MSDRATVTETLTETVTETVVRRHLQAFLEQRGVDAIVSDYHDAAVFITEAKIHRGKQEIRGFFEDFLAALPERAMERFSLESLHFDQDIAYITWCVEDDIPLGTDTFVVANGKIASQTFAMVSAGRATGEVRT